MKKGEENLQGTGIQRKGYTEGIWRQKLQWTKGTLEMKSNIAMRA